MSILTTCGACGSEFKVRDEFAGKRGKCPKCGQPVQVPGIEAAGGVPSSGLKRAEPLPPTEAGTPAKAAAARPAAPHKRPPVPGARRPATEEGIPTISVGESSTSSVTARIGSRRSRSGMPMWAWIVLAVAGVGVIGVLGFFVLSDSPGPTNVAARDNPDAGSLSEPGETSEPEEEGPGADPDDLGIDLSGLTEEPEEPEESGDRPEQPQDEPGRPGTGTEEGAFPAPKLAKSLEDVKEAIVKFELPTAAGNRMEIGSGFLVDNRGWIATNNHVVAHATTASRVRMANGMQCRLGGIIARAPEHDLAIVKLEERPFQLTILDVRYNATPRLGEMVYAFGHPYNVEFSLSKGIVSRVVTTAELLASTPNHIVSKIHAPGDLVWIQHDAKISPGNSGGPLLAEDGRVIGINTFVHTQAEYGYASHVKYLREVMAGASGEVTPFPAGQEVAQQPVPGQPRPGQTVINPAQMKPLFDGAAGFGWKPENAEQYATLAELAKLMTAVKHAQAMPAAAGNAPPQIVAQAAAQADELFGQIRSVEWNEEHSKAINQFAVEGVDQAGQGIMAFTTVLGNAPNALMLQVQGTDTKILVQVGPGLAASPGGSRLLVLAMVTPQIAQVNATNQPEPQQMRVLLAHYMLKIE